MTCCLRAFFVCLGGLWLIASSLGIAQEPSYLKVQTNRLQKAQQAEQEALAKRDSSLLAEAYYLYGKTYSFTGDYQNAHRYFIKSLRILEPKGFSEELSRLYYRLSNIEIKQGHLTEAVRYGRYAMHIARSLKSDTALSRACIGLGQVYANIWTNQRPQARTSYDSSLFFYGEAEAACRRLKDSVGVADVYAALGELLASARHPQAATYLEKSLTLFQFKKKADILLKVMPQLAGIYLDNGQFDKAWQLLSDAEKQYKSRNLNDYDTQIGIDVQLVRYYEKTNQWKLAYERLRQLERLQNYAFRADHQGAITRLNVEYETEKKEALLKAQNRELMLRTETLQSQRRFTITLSLLLVLVTAMSLVFFRLNRRNQRISRQNEALVKEQNHRVKNNLQVVASLLNLQAKRLSDESARKAVEESRLRIQSMAIVHRRLYDGEKLAQIDLDEFVRELVQGVLKTFGYPALEPHFTIAPIPLTVDKAVPMGLILNELITNACKYAFPANDTPQLWISCRQRGVQLECTVADNGPGFDNTETSFWDDNVVVQRTSFGMALIDAQVAQLSGTYSFSTGEGGKGTLFSMVYKL
ncbi:histidine kinase dimerization/phosphoacceptor domain -containing protein [Spirosoma aerolatum]|uniref:histidine kinase dimerization/phosphoacceptor domain -containing protein n=1 Tax=Spirosoma aerolatum TaxID=1211326 RepID=UPI0009ACEFFE|nr:histidine kinase dimerization/phosphoacceptor domain -containing protein [Spirosoma aerolatum]